MPGFTLSVKSLSSGWTVIKEVTISASPSRVFGSLTKPSELNVWFTQGAAVDLRVGGGYRNLDHDRGRFLDIVPNERLRFTWDNPEYATGSIVEILLKNLGGKTVLTLIHSGFRHKSDFEDYSSQESGWNWALSNLKAHLEGRKIITYEDFLKNRK